MASMGLLHTFTKLAAVVMLVALIWLAMMVMMMIVPSMSLMVAICGRLVVVPSVVAVVVPSVVMQQRRTVAVAFVVARLARLVACVHLLHFRAFFRSLFRGAFWICIEHLLQYVNLELGASLTFCTLASRAAFFDGGQIMTCFHVRFQWPWTLGVTLLLGLWSCSIVICCAAVVAAMRSLDLLSQSVLHLSAQLFELHILITVLTPVVFHCYEGHNSSQKSKRYKKTSDAITLHFLRCEYG
jgi:hypothetical protein